MSTLHVPKPVTPMMPRTLFGADHETFRATARRFFETEVAPHQEKWEAQQHIDRDLWNKAGELGLLCCTMPTEYGGSGVDRLFSMILMEEQARVGDSASGFSLHSDIVANYLINFGTPAQKAHWLPKMASGEVVTAIAMTEPGTGSDLQGIQATAKLEGDEYVINGAKIFITNGYLCDMAIVAVKTGESAKGSANVSLMIVEADRDQIYRVFANLGRNAFEAGARHVRVQVVETLDPGMAVDVSDDGPGLARAARDGLFEPFKGSVRQGGTGLGLVIARDVMRAHGGDIALARSGDDGTVFRLTFPEAD